MTINAPPVRATVGMPPAAPLSTPTQALRADQAPNVTRTETRVLAARVIAFGGTLALTAVGGFEMAMVVSTGGSSSSKRR